MFAANFVLYCFFFVYKQYLIDSRSLDLIVKYSIIILTIKYENTSFLLVKPKSVLL